MNDNDIRHLAEAAGISVHWKDAFGRDQTVAPDVLRTILEALDLPCSSDDQLKESWARIAAENSNSTLPPLLTCTAGTTLTIPIEVGQHGLQYRIDFEDGGSLEGQLLHDAAGALGLVAPENPGYHRLQVGGQETTLAIAPLRCFSIEDAVQYHHGNAGGNAKPWGLAAQLYGIRRQGDGGLGDFSSLKLLAQQAAQHGASALAISPVHAMFSADRNRFSPYSPSSRLFLNVLHIDPAAVSGNEALAQVLEEAGYAKEYTELEQLDLIDWPRASGIRLDLLRRLYARFKSQDRSEHAAFEEFCRHGGEALLDHARFETLHAHFSKNGQDGVNGFWRTWPEAFRNPRSTEVANFAEAHADEVNFHLFLQWQAALGLAEAQRGAKEAGMPVGLIADLAVGADNGGSQAWSRQSELLHGLSIGAPPDVLNALGQSWGLGAFSPRALKLHGFRAYIEMLRAAFAYAGGVRIDHVLGLMRLWVIPEGANAQQGAYLRYPMDDLLRLIALESLRHRAIVIGEDLGTIPEGLGDRLAQAGLLGIRVLLFQRDGGRFTPPRYWSSHAVAMTTTHDTPTLAGWWAGHDIEWRTKLNLRKPDDSEEADRNSRNHERAALWQAMVDAGCATGDIPPPQTESTPLNEAVSFFGKTGSPLAILPLEDALGLADQPNLPGTIDEHPNWRRRLPQPVDQVLNQPATTVLLSRLNDARSNS